MTKIIIIFKGRDDFAVARRMMSSSNQRKVSLRARAARINSLSTINNRVVITTVAGRPYIKKDGRESRLSMSALKDIAINGANIHFARMSRLQVDSIMKEIYRIRDEEQNVKIK